MSEYDDIVGQLRTWSGFVSSGYEVPAAGRTMNAAADAIEALVGEVERLKLALWDIATNADAASDLPLFRVQCRDFARKALEAKP